MQDAPVGDDRGNEQPFLVVDGKELGLEKVHGAVRMERVPTIVAQAMGASTGRAAARGFAALLVLLAATAAAAQPAPDGWSDLPLPGGRAALLPALGVAPDLPRALVVTELVRVLHAGPQPDPAAARLLQQFHEAP